MWIANYGLLVKALYGALKAVKKGIIIWTENTRAAFKQLKHSLMAALSQGLLDLTKPVELFTYERLNVALGILAQRLRNQRRAVASFSKQPENVAQSCPECPKAVVATVILMQEAQNLTLDDTLQCMYLL